MIDGIRSAGVRAVVQSGWAGLTAAGDDVLSVSDVPHEWLFPQVSAVVHHAGAGTTGAGLRAGVPALTIPTMVDQPFWAQRLLALGVSPAPLALKGLTTENFAAALRSVATDSALRARAVELSARVRAEDGATAVVQAVDRLAARPGD